MTSYQLPIAREIPPPAEVDGFEAPFPFDIRQPPGRPSARTTARTSRPAAAGSALGRHSSDDPMVHVGVLAYFSDMTGASFRPHSLGVGGTHTDASLDHALWFHRPWRADTWSIFDIHALVNAGGQGHHPCDHARRGRHLAPEHGAGAADPGARRTAAGHVTPVD